MRTSYTQWKRNNSSWECSFFLNGRRCATSPIYAYHTMYMECTCTDSVRMTMSETYCYNYRNILKRAWGGGAKEKPFSFLFAKSSHQWSLKKRVFLVISSLLFSMSTTDMIRVFFYERR
uniref:Uncharacterized protein n=1 Tax=Sipha flava TaxID=143950 RepID=A0A2S2Q8S5_9HEMI